VGGGLTDKLPKLFDTQAGYRSGDHQLLDLAGAFEDRVAHGLGFSWCASVVSCSPDLVIGESAIPPRVTVSTRF
jgi:hypothetical protein